jgi:alkanesulfonate monooxygenase SsuD/methylene tetrahydromethanopterin reductase-like flavin-dependent oxidoreductase (luciferase family)
MPTIVGAALSEATAAEIAAWADGMITVNAAPEKLVRMIEAFRARAGAHAPVYIQSHVSFAPTEEEARANAMRQWRTNVLAGDLGADLWLPQQFDAAATYIRPDDLDGAIRISADVGQHREWIAQDLALGVNGVYIHNVGPNQEAFIDAYGSEVLPEVLATT